MTNLDKAAMLSLGLLVVIGVIISLLWYGKGGENVKEWQKVGYFADGVVYACGKDHKIVIRGCPVIYYEMDTKKVWWV